jgi:hypothetical protein
MKEWKPFGWQSEPGPPHAQPTLDYRFRIGTKIHPALLRRLCLLESVDEIFAGIAAGTISTGHPALVEGAGKNAISTA